MRLPELEEKVAIVTGGGQGIGKGIAQHFLEEGMGVVIAELDAEAGEETCRELGSLGPVRFFQTDVTHESSVKKTVDDTVREFGRLDALINNAGIARSSQRPVEALPLEEWNRMIATNLTGTFLCVKHAIPYLRQRRGAIVNIASTRAFQSEPDTEAYSASKGGVVALTHALANSLGPEIRVNCICPGWIEVSLWKKSSQRRPPDLRPVDHAQHPVGRVGEPGDISSLVVFLISDRAGFVTGQSFVVDGGMTRKMIYEE